MKLSQTVKAFLLSAIVLSPLACGKNDGSNPTAPSNPPATATSTSPAFSPTLTVTSSPTDTPSNSPTATTTSTPTATNTSTNTATSTPTFTQTSTSTNSFSPTPVFTDTATPTFSGTPSFTPTNTSTSTFTGTSTPTSTKTSTPTFTPSKTPTVTFTPTSVIHFYNAEIYHEVTSTGITTTKAVLYLKVNGLPDTGAAVTLTGPGTAKVALNAGSVITTADGDDAYYSTTSFTYQAGATYTLSAATSDGTGSFTGVAPGGNLTVNSAGTTASWDVDSALNRVYVNITSGNIYYDTPSTSPASIPATVYNGYPSPTTFSVYVPLINQQYGGGLTFSNVDSVNATLQDVLTKNVVY